MNTVFIRELRLQAWVGIHKHEKAAPQTIELDIELELPGEAVFTSHKVRDTIDYAAVVARLKELFEAERFGLVEVLADRVAAVLLTKFHAPRARVAVTKLGILKEARKVGAVVERRS